MTPFFNFPPKCDSTIFSVIVFVKLILLDQKIFATYSCQQNGFSEKLQEKSLRGHFKLVQRNSLSKSKKPGKNLSTKVYL